jgi:SAM-dependent methyltransferase
LALLEAAKALDGEPGTRRAARSPFRGLQGSTAGARLFRGRKASGWRSTNAPPAYSQSVNEAAYDQIGRGYSNVRQPDPRIAARIDAALGDARTVLNVGAGTGSYEPTDREVTAVEPSAQMIAQRPAGSAPVVQASAEELPFAADSFDAAMGVLTAHHWTDLGAGLKEMRRVTRQRILIVAFDPGALANLWITRDYFPAMLELKRRSPVTSTELARMLSTAHRSPIPVPRDCTDQFFAALWARPEMLFDEEVVRPMWAWQSISEAARREGRERLAADLKSGAWDERYGHLREMAELDVGLRLVVAELNEGVGGRS